MTIIKHNKIMHTWVKLKTNKTEMRIKENIGKNLLSWKTKIMEKLSYKSSICKERRFNP